MQLDSASSINIQTSSTISARSIHSKVSKSTDGADSKCDSSGNNCHNSNMRPLFKHYRYWLIASIIFRNVSILMTECTAKFQIKWLSDPENHTTCITQFDSFIFFLFAIKLDDDGTLNCLKSFRMCVCIVQSDQFE